MRLTEAGRDLTVGIEIERHIDLGHAAGCRRDSFEIEFAEKMVVARHRPFTFEHLDAHCRLKNNADVHLATRATPNFLVPDYPSR